MRVVFLGSGAFGLPTLEAVRRAHDVVLVVSQPDRPAGRKRVLTPTAVSAYAVDHGLELIRPESPDTPETLMAIEAARPDALVVIAYGHKLAPALLEDRFAINLHASLLPKYRGAAPINRAMMAGDSVTGVSVIALAQRMDAGVVYASARTAIDPGETAGELHDRLAALGPDAVLGVLEAHARGEAVPEVQDDALATPAPKLSKVEGTVDFDQPATLVRARVHGLTPWPGCTVYVGDDDGRTLKLLRVRDLPERVHDAAPGTVLEDHAIACAEGALELLSVQPPGGRAMTIEAYARGHALEVGERMRGVGG